MHIAIGKIGKSTKFNSATWNSPIAPNEAPVFYQTIARLNPDKTFYLVGKSDYHRLSPELKKQVTPHNNIVDIWELYNKNEDNQTTFPYDYFKKNNIEIDFGMFYSGSVAGVNIPNLVKKKNKDEYVKVLETYINYAAPVVHYLNESKIKYFTLSPDPRYVPIRAEDILNVEKFSLTLFNDHKTVERMKSFEEQNTYVKHELDCFYTAIESVILMGLPKKDITSFNKTKKFVIFHNEGGLKELDRGKVLKQYIPESIFPEVEIYGKWNQKWLDKDTRFKGSVTFETLQTILPEVKYTFMIPIERGVMSMKFWETINQGIIPFMHPWYDEDKYLKCPDFIRISSPEDLKQKIDYLEANPEEYKKLHQQLISMLTDDLYNGQYMNKIINEHIQKLLTEY